MAEALATAAAEILSSDGSPLKGLTSSSSSSQQQVFFSSLPQYLCEPLINYLRRSTDRSRQFTDCKTRRNSNRVASFSFSLNKSAESQDRIEWIDDVWEKYLRTLKTEIEIVLQERDKNKLEPATLQPLRNLSQGSDEAVGELSQASRSSFQNSSTKVIPAVSNKSWTDNSYTRSIPTSGWTRGSETVISNGQLHAPSVIPTTIRKPSSSTPPAKNSSESEMKSKPAKSKARGATFLVPIQSYLELPQKDSACTVLSKICGERVQSWFEAHRTAAKRFCWLIVSFYMVSVICSPMIPLWLRGLECFIQTTTHLWLSFYFASISKWRVTVKSLVKFDAVFLGSEAAMLVFGMICMNYVGSMLPPSDIEGAAAKEGMTVDSYKGYQTALFIYIIITWSTLGLALMSTVLFCDGFELKEKHSMRYIYLSLCILIFAYLGLVYFRFSAPDSWVYSYLDFYEGFGTYINQASRTATYAKPGFRGPQRINLFDFYLNRLATICILSLRVCINSFLYPEDFMFIKSRMRMITYPDPESTTAAQTGKSGGGKINASTS